MNWYGKVFRKIHWDFDNPPFLKDVAEKFDVEQFVAGLKEASVEAINFFTRDVFGQMYYESRISGKHPGLKGDILKEITNACHRNDIKVLFYLVTIDQITATSHPEWRHVSKSGTDWGHNVICLNSPYLDEVIIPQIKELLEYEPDGFFYDIVSQMVNRLCFCPSCQRKFQKELGRNLPTTKGDPFWLDALQWRRRVVDNFEKRVADSIHQIAPGVLFGSNWSHCTTRPTSAPDYLDYLTLDIGELLSKEGCRGALGSNPLGISMEGRYLSTLNKPFDIMNSRYLYWWSDWMLKPVASLKMECATAIANGGKVFIGDKIYCDGTVEKSAMKAMGETLKFISEREDYCRDSTPVPYIGVVHSDSTMLHTIASVLPEEGGQTRALTPIEGAHKALVESHFHFNIINEHTLLENISSYKALVLPEQDVLSEELKESIRTFVFDGGGLVVSCPSPLVDVLGIEEDGRFPYSFGYIKVTDKAVAARIGDFPVMVHAPFSKIRADSAESLACLYAPKWDRPSLSFAAPQGSIGEDTGYPAVTLNKFGKGKAVFISGRIFSAYWAKNNPHLKYLIRNLVNLVIPEKLLEVDGPASLEVSLFQEGQKKIVHLVNSHIEKNIGGPCFAEEIPRLLDVNVRLKVQNRPEKVVQQPEDKQIEFLLKKGIIEFKVPEVNIHTVIIVE